MVDARTNAKIDQVKNLVLISLISLPQAIKTASSIGRDIFLLHSFAHSKPSDEICIFNREVSFVDLYYYKQNDYFQTSGVNVRPSALLSAVFLQIINIIVSGSYEENERAYCKVK